MRPALPSPALTPAHASGRIPPSLSSNESAGSDGGADGSGGATVGPGVGNTLGGVDGWAIAEDGNRMLSAMASAVVRRKAWPEVLTVLSSFL